MRTNLVLTILFVYSATANARVAAPDAELALAHDRVDTGGVRPLLARMIADHSNATKFKDGFLVARAEKPKKPKPVKSPDPKPALKPATKPVFKPAPKSFVNHAQNSLKSHDFVCILSYN